MFHYVFTLCTKCSARSVLLLGYYSVHCFEFRVIFRGASTAPVMAAQDAGSALHKGLWCPSGPVWEWDCEKLAMRVHTVKVRGEGGCPLTTGRQDLSCSPVPATTYLNACPMQYLRHSYTKKLFIVHLKFKCNWVSCILLGNSVVHPAHWNLSWQSSCPPPPLCHGPY